MITDNIIYNWNSSPSNHAVLIADMDPAFPAWTVKLENDYGVAIPYAGADDIYEVFSGARMCSSKILIEEQTEQKVLLLTAHSVSMQVPFSVLCAEFVAPGDMGSYREEISVNPSLWWSQWKELLGNKNVDARVYDVLGELCVLRELLRRGKQASWTGPTGGTYDFQTETEYFEAKSSVIRSRREISVSSSQQLNPPNGSLHLVFCQFEISQNGDCINSLVDELEVLGYSRKNLNDLLAMQGFHYGKSSRTKTYMLHSMIAYPVDENFPVINNASFVDGTLPKGIEKITYTVSLDGLTGEFWIGQV